MENLQLTKKGAFHLAGFIFMAALQMPDGNKADQQACGLLLDVLKKQMSNRDRKEFEDYVKDFKLPEPEKMKKLIEQATKELDNNNLKNRNDVRK
jgi:uncharacterized protein HemY